MGHFISNFKHKCNDYFFKIKVEVETDVDPEAKISIKTDVENLNLYL